MNQNMALMENYMPGIILALGVLVILVCISQILLYRKFNAVQRKYKLLNRGPSGADLEAILQQYASDVVNQEKQVQEHTQVLEKIQEQVAQSIYNPGLIRFNAFDNMGSDLSFSLALLDRHGDGVVLTGLYGRDETRVYCKPIRKGNSDYSLTEEEIKAVHRSQEKFA